VDEASFTETVGLTTAHAESTHSSPMPQAGVHCPEAEMQMWRSTAHDAPERQSALTLQRPRASGRHAAASAQTSTIAAAVGLTKL
jgi:hypothetical protein